MTLAKISDAHTPRILCIDDDPQIVESLALRLMAYDVEVMRAYHGMHGLWLAMTGSPDLIITDIRMPQGAGNYIIQCVRDNRETRGIPIIVFTGHRDPKIGEEVRRLGADDVFTKPIHFGRLVSAIRNHISLIEIDWSKCAAMAT